jgi:two-component system sensor histidine kinase CpxA
MAARLERQLESQKQFVADVAHEVTAPLARLRVGLDLIEPRLPAEARAAHADLEEDAQQMSALLDELLLFSRAGQMRGQEPAERVLLAPLVAEVLAQEAAAQDGSAPVVVAVASALAVQAPRALLQRALANLVRNALRHGQQPIEVLAAADAGGVQLSVRDRGPGVPVEALARLGEPFYRPEFARSRDTGGTGLGLAIVRRCVAACGGQVRFGNRPDGGFEAVLLLPPGEPA